MVDFIKIPKELSNYLIISQIVAQLEPSLGFSFFLSFFFFFSAFPLRQQEVRATLSVGLCKLVLHCFHSHLLFILLNVQELFFLCFYMLMILSSFYFPSSIAVKKLYCCCAFSATLMRLGYCNLLCSEGILFLTGSIP